MASRGVSPLPDPTSAAAEPPDETMLLCIFVSELARDGLVGDCRALPLYEAIVLMARDMGLAGATVLRGLMGYGRSGQVQASKVVSLAQDLPVVIRIVDSPEKIEGFLPVLADMMTGGLATIAPVRPHSSAVPHAV